MNADEVQRRLATALQRFSENDFILLEYKLHECCIAGRLAMYLQAEFPQYSVDVEYSRHELSPKKLKNLERCANKTDEQGYSIVRPDIVVHCRGNDGSNLLVLEVKKQRDSDCNRKRIRAFREQYGYTFGATIICVVGDAGKVRSSKWFDERNPDGI